MAVQIQGANGTIAQVDGSTFQALRTTSRPPDYGSLGEYSYGGFTGILGAALGANSEIFQFRWTDATRLCVVNKVVISACVSTTFFAAGVPVQIDLVKATSWSAAGTGGTSVTPAATMKKRTSMGSTLIATGDIRISTTAALGAGTKTLEANAMASVAAPGPITASLNGQIVPPGTPLFELNVAHGQGPMVLVQNEGFVIRSVAVPGTGTWTVGVTVDWQELAAY